MHFMAWRARFRDRNCLPSDNAQHHALPTANRTRSHILARGFIGRNSASDGSAKITESKVDLRFLLQLRLLRPAYSILASSVKENLIQIPVKRMRITFE